MPHPRVLVKTLTRLLTQKQQCVTTAESCTGGMLAMFFTDQPGSSQWFERGFVTYSNASKQTLLNVPEDLIRQYGAVSIEVAGAMATGALKMSQADLSIAITGIAGPDGGSAEKPVGTVCFAWSYQGQTCAKQIHFSPATRHRIRLLACEEAIQGSITLLKTSS